MPFLTKLTFLPMLLSVLLFNGCQMESKTDAAKKTESELKAKKNHTAFAINLNIFSSHLRPYEIDALDSILEAFEQGLLEEYKNTDLKTAYELLALGFRKEILDEGRPTGLYPFKGGFDRSVLETKAAQLSFLTKACGFQNSDDEIIAYYCFKSESKFIDFYREATAPNEFIKRFFDSYQKEKNLSPDLKQQILFNPADELNFAAVEDRLFYALVLLMINEEIIAYQKATNS